MKRTLLAVILFFAPAAPAWAGALQGEWRECHAVCDAIGDECQYLNDLETCEKSRRGCSASCDDRYPTLAICVDQCDGLLLFCRNAGAARGSACREENATCLSRCERAVVSRLD